MKEQIEAKIEELTRFILNKPAARITLDDYTILAAELRDLRFREERSESGKRIADLMAAAFPVFPGDGSVK